MARIFVVEDEQQLSSLVANWLKGEMHTVETCSDGSEALLRIKAEQFDAVILDIMLPGMDGLEVCKKYRAVGGTAPILMLTAKRALAAKEEGLDSGADDYLTKPFKLRELSARIRALLRRHPAITPCVLQVGDVVLDTNSQRVFRRAKEIKLLPKEFAMLELLLKNPGSIVRSEDLITSIWGPSSDISFETVRSHVRLLRQKIDDPGAQSLIETVHGTGYRLFNNVQ